MSATDRELLELAAKAAGIPVTPDCHIPSGGMWMFNVDVDKVWNPLEDDGDALRLAVDLGLRIYPFASTVSGYACSAVAGGDNTRIGEAVSSGDTRADTRRAIVLAAAYIGRAMP